MAILATDLFAALSHDTRIRALMMLAEHGELCVCELTYAIRVSQPHLSRHLAHLRDLQIVATRRAGIWVFYQLNPDLPPWAQAVLRETLAGLRENTPFVDDTGALKEMPNRPDSPRCDSPVGLALAPGQGSESPRAIFVPLLSTQVANE